MAQHLEQAVTPCERKGEPGNCQGALQQDVTLASKEPQIALAEVRRTRCKPGKVLREVGLLRLAVPERESLKQREVGIFDADHVFERLLNCAKGSLPEHGP